MPFSFPLLDFPADDRSKPNFVDINPFELDDAIPGPRVIDDDEGMGRCSPGNTSCVVILSYIWFDVPYRILVS